MWPSAWLNNPMRAGEGRKLRYLYKTKPNPKIETPHPFIEGKNNMASYNRVVLLGNLTRDPEIKYTPKGTAICEIGLAVNHTYTSEGEKRESVMFCDITFWGRTAEIVGEYCKKGRPLFVEGRLTLDTWDDNQTGQKRSKLKVVGENIQLLGGKPEGESQPPRNAQPPQRQGPPQRAQGRPAPQRPEPDYEP